MAKPLFVGELNPYGADPYYALYPAPDGCSGERLCRFVLGLGRAEYLDRFDRANLCEGKWAIGMARERAAEIWQEAVALERPAVVILGRKVAEAFEELLDIHPPFSSAISADGIRIVWLPHPSGLCRVWSEDGAVEKARAVLAKAGVL